MSKTLEALENTIQNLAIENAALKAVATVGGDLDLLGPVVAKHLKATLDDNGQVKVSVVDGFGNPRIGDAQGNPLTPTGLVAEMKRNPTFAPAFGGKAQATASSGKKRSEMTMAEKGEFARLHGADAFMALPE